MSDAADVCKIEQSEHHEHNEKLPSARIGMKRCHWNRMMTDTKTGKSFVMPWRCGKWNCECCRPRLIEAWIVHIIGLFQSLLGEFPLQRVEVQAGAWEGFARHLRRKQRRYIRLRRDNSCYVVWYADPESGEFAVDRAIEIITADLHEMRGLYRCVSTSQGWKLPEGENPEPGRYKLAMDDQLQQPAHIAPQVAIQVAELPIFRIAWKRTDDRVELETQYMDPSSLRYFVRKCVELTAARADYPLHTPCTSQLVPNGPVSVKKDNTDSDDESHEPWMGDDTMLMLMAGPIRG